MQYEQSVLEQLQKTELEIAKVVHDFCVANGIQYSLAYGTLIGAVRHQGFIPWDDDIDIMMLREDYDRFRRLWLEDPPKGYFLVDKETDKSFGNNFLKVEKENTTFVENESQLKQSTYPLGIFVDIYPCDRLPNGRLKRKLYFFAGAVNLLYSREHKSGTGGLVGIMETILLDVFPKRWRKPLLNWSLRKLTQWNENPKLLIIMSDTIRALKRAFPSDSFEDLATVRFSGLECITVKNYDIWLKVIYGNYLELPPKEERVWKHSPMMLDFDKAIR